MRTKIILEGVELDLSKEIEASFTYSIAELSDPEKRNSSWSKTITIPGSPLNNRTFGEVFDMDLENPYDPFLPNRGINFNPSKSAKALILVDELDIISGVLRLLQVNVQDTYVEYEVAISGRLISIASAFGDSTLQNLDFGTTYDHTYNRASITGSWGNTSGYVYPLIDYGYSQDNITYPLKNFKPAVFVRTLWDKLFAQAGYTYSSNFIETSPLFQKLIIPHIGGEIKHSTEYATANKDKSVEVRKTDEQQGMFFTEALIYFQNEVKDAGDLFQDNSVWIADQIREVTVKLNYRIKGLRRPDHGSDQGAIRIYKSTDDGGSWTLMENGEFTFITSTLDSDNPAIWEGTLEVDDTTTSTTRYHVRLWEEGDGNRYWVLPDSRFYVTIKDQDVNVVEGETLQFAASLPAMSQKDFFKSIITLFNLYVEPDEFDENRLIIDPYPEYFNTDKTQAYDWSDKLDISKQIEIKPMSELTAKKYVCGYTEDSDEFNKRYKDFYGELYGDRPYEVDNDFVTEKKEIKVSFAATPLVNFDTNKRVLSAIYKKNGELKEPFVGKPRILIYGGLLPSRNVDGSNAMWFIEGEAPFGHTTYPYAGHLDNPFNPTEDINFGVPIEIFFNFSGSYPTNGLFNRFYSDHLAEITNKNSKLLTGYFRLTPLDITRLNFRKFIYLAGTYYRLNKVVDYSITQDGLTKVELLKLNNI